MSELTIRCKVHFGRMASRAADVGPGTQPAEEVATEAQPAPAKVRDATSAPVARVTRMLALAYAIERLVEAGDLKDYAAAARLLGLTRARISQVMDLLSLAPGIQDGILAGKVAVGERRLRAVVREAEWGRQHEFLGERRSGS